MSFRGLTLFPLYGAPLLLGTSLKITDANQNPSPLLAGPVTSFEEALDWLQFTYTAD